MKRLNNIRLGPLAAACLLTAAVVPITAADHPQIDRHQGWVSLFNGVDLAGWKIIDVRGGTEPNAWVVEAGCLPAAANSCCKTIRARSSSAIFISSRWIDDAFALSSTALARIGTVTPP